MVRAIFVLFFLIASVKAHQHKATIGQRTTDCQHIAVECGQTVTSAVAPDGKIWRVWSQQQQLFYQVSSNDGQHFAPAIKVDIAPEEISSRGENRVKIAFDRQGGIYLSWASPREKRFTADIRFSYSLDNGQSFAVATTINDDGLLAGHSFNEMQVSDSGKVSLIWLDSRDKVLAADKSAVNGSSIYFAEGWPRKNDLAFNNQRLVSGTCQCCRLAFDTNQQGEAALLWRHIYQQNTREFALLTLDGKKEPVKVSDDRWQINGCPHQGGALSIDRNNRYHMTWYNQGEKGKGIFYAYSDDQGSHLSQPLAFGNNGKNAAHPHMLSWKNRVDIVWLEANDSGYSLWHSSSNDYGKTFTSAKQLHQVKGSADRPFVIAGSKSPLVSWHSANQQHWIHAL
ncbi:lipoprotein [Thalassotalea insulae]|uniref:Lipoprotein n=1 Tax=Thalassotalea insulae TaxID=2056778 RepID=A0ABQ6GS45_9GAMM|nr:exo-alpha-sialidase [Thalassotalea insulae]GLX78768.1 lipoprotein [Thalassotalea insulae]